MAPERRFDTWQTSYGKGHEYRPGTYFPDTNFRATRTDPLPPSLSVPINDVTNPYDTTTGATHDRKYLTGTCLDNPREQRAGGSWKVHHMKDHIEKLENRRHRPALTMGNEESEMKARYKGETKIPGVDFEHRSQIGPQGFVLENHHGEGPSKTGQASSQNPELQGQEFFPKDRGVLRELDPYVSTTHKDHRAWDDMELTRYPKKDIATYWSCEEYPKAWGHGPQNNQLPKGAVPRDRPPMRDTLQFKHATRVPFWPKSAKPVPNSSYKSEAASRFTVPSEERMRDAIYCPVDAPYTFQEVPPADIGLPGHYNTMYEFIGNRDKVTVTS